MITVVQIAAGVALAPVVFCLGVAMLRGVCRAGEALQDAWFAGEVGDYAVVSLVIGAPFALWFLATH
jgi:hypothetical protein